MSPNITSASTCSSTLIGNILLVCTTSGLKTWDIKVDLKSNEYVCMAKSQKLLPLVATSSGRIIDVCWDDLGTRVAQLQEDGTLNVIDYSTARVVSSLQVKTVQKHSNRTMKRMAFVKQSSNQICIAHDSVQVFGLNASSSNTGNGSTKLLNEFSAAGHAHSPITGLSVMTHRLVTATSSGEVYTHSLRDNRTHALNASKKQNITSVTCSPFKRWVAATGDEGILYIWDINKGANPFYETSSIHNGPILSILFSSVNKNSYCTVGLDRKIKMHNITETGKHEVLWESRVDDEPTCVSLNGDSMIAVGTANGRIFIFDLHWKDPIKVINVTSGDGPVQALQFHPAAKLSNPIAQENLIMTSSNSSTKKIEQRIPGIEKSRVVHIQKDKNILDVFSPITAFPKSYVNSSQDIAKYSGIAKLNLTGAFLSTSDQSKEETKEIELISSQKKSPSSVSHPLCERLTDNIMPDSASSDATPENLSRLRRDTTIPSTSSSNLASQRVTRRVHSISGNSNATTSKSNSQMELTQSKKVSSSQPLHDITQPDQEATAYSSKPKNGTDSNLKSVFYTSSNLAKSTARAVSSATEFVEGKDAVMNRVRKLLDRSKTKSPPRNPLQSHHFGGLVGSVNEESCTLTTRFLAEIRDKSTPSSTTAMDSSNVIQKEEILAAEPNFEVIEENIRPQLEENTLLILPTSINDLDYTLDMKLGEKKQEIAEKVTQALHDQHQNEPSTTPTTLPFSSKDHTTSTKNSSFQYQMIANIIEESLSKFKVEIRNDLLNVHLEMIKQFYQQRVELEDLIVAHSAVSPLLEEIHRLEEENDRLRRHF